MSDAKETPAEERGSAAAAQPRPPVKETVDHMIYHLIQGNVKDETVLTDLGKKVDQAKRKATGPLPHLP